ncbi:hypothetical protein V6N12_066166 [Hibiscus sabdariffa]|uniref:Uncharacterized protein n=1 Tax=Hibiscus sabdariffa TaxID=183260 RepID=A0ABR2BAS5_9ROSI
MESLKDSEQNLQLYKAYNQGFRNHNGIHDQGIGAVRPMLAVLARSCVSGYGLFCEKQKPLENRKMLLQADLKVNNGSSTGAGYWGNFRTVPSGPDPLHHNGGSPKKPKTDP